MRYGRVLSAFGVLGLAVCAPAATLVVDADGGGQFPTIQPAIDAAAAGDIVLVRPGEYVITEPITFRGKGITVRGEAGPEETTIRMAELPGDPEHASVVIFENGETSAAVLAGVTLTGGQGALWGVGWGKGGGGVLCRGHSSPSMTNCAIAGNTVEPFCVFLCMDGFGGGLCCREDSSPTLTDCTISGNWTGDSGGGVYCDNSSPTLINCTILGNTAGFGGGMSCELGSSPTLADCAIAGNWAGYGGGVSCEESSSPRLANCTIAGNLGSWGGGVYCDRSSPALTSCTIAENAFGSTDGGGVYCQAESSPTLTNCILWGNSGGAFVSADDSNAPAVSYSCAEGDPVWPGEGNIQSDPLFVRLGQWEDCGVAAQSACLAYQWDPGTYEPTAWRRWVFDYRLQVGSPCIDAGTAEGVPTTDIEGKLRPCGAGLDMGAYEFGSCWPSTPFLRGDANSDSRLDIADAIFTLSCLFAKGTAPSCLDAGDANDSGAIDIADAISILSHLFARAGPLKPPFGTCGIDLTDDALDCASFPSCEGK